MSLLTTVISILLNGLQQGAIYVLLAVGLSIILGTMEFVNFAHGALYILGAYFGLYVYTNLNLSNGWVANVGLTDPGLGVGPAVEGALQGLPLPPVVGSLFAFFVVIFIVSTVIFILGVLMERFVASAFYDRSDTDQILVTFGLAIVVQELLRVAFGSSGQNFPQPIDGAVPIEGVAISWWRVAIVVITALMVAGVYLLIEYTDFGLVVRAGTEDAEMVKLMGIRITRPYLVLFGIGASLAGIAGVVGAPLNPINPTAGTDILVPAFVTVVIGGVGSIRGAVLGGLLLGLTQATLIQVSIGSYNLAPWSQVGIYALAALILLWRPQGILGSEVQGA